MTDALAPVALDLARWLRNKPGVTEVQPPVMSPRMPKARTRLPMPAALPLPIPRFLKSKRQASFEIRCTYKGKRRVFRYFVETLDDAGDMRDVLVVHTNGELLVEVPDEFGHLLPNDIYYDNRSRTVSVLGGYNPGT